MKAFAILIASLAFTASAAPALAQGGTNDSSSKINAVASKDLAPGFDDASSPFEKANTTYRFLGARFRYIVIPKFYMNLFGSGGATVGVPAFGPEFTIRKNDFEYVLSVMYASYSMDPTPFKAKSDGNDAWEIVDANIKGLYLMSDFLWSTELSPKFAINYGAGFGLAAVFGDIHRVQAYPGSGGAGDPYTYQRCIGPNNPPGQGLYCDTANNHYGDYTEPSWADGGSKPIVFPWLAIQTGVRFKPARQFMMRLDIGWNLLNGPFFGIAANYGL